MTIDLQNDFLSYLADHAGEPGSQLPPLTELSQTLGISVSKLREQMEVARALGLVSIRPRTGIQTRQRSGPRPTNAAKLDGAADTAKQRFNVVLTD